MSSSCLTLEDAPWAGLFGNGLECSGNGVCVNGTSSGVPLCLCDAGWSGGADMFDLRVDVDALGRPLALDCPVNILASQLFWGLFLIANIVRWGGALMAFKKRVLNVPWPRLPNGSKKSCCDVFSASVYELSHDTRKSPLPIRVVLFLDCVFVTPWLLALSILKIALPYDEVIGTTVGSTMLLAGTAFWAVCIHIWFSLQQFKALVFVHSGNQDTAEKLYYRYRRSRFMSLFFLLCMNVVPTMATLALDKSLGPVANFEFVMMIVRNIGNTLWVSFDLFAGNILQRQVQGLVESLSNNAFTSQDAKKVIAYLKEEYDKLKKQMLVALVVYPVFSLPWLWPYQNYQIAFLTTLGSIGGAVGLIVFRSALKAESSQKSSNLGQTASNSNSPNTGGTAGAKVADDQSPLVTAEQPVDVSEYSHAEPYQDSSYHEN